MLKSIDNKVIHLYRKIYLFFKYNPLTCEIIETFTVLSVKLSANRGHVVSEDGLKQKTHFQKTDYVLILGWDNSGFFVPIFFANFHSTGYLTATIYLTLLSGPQ
jgi:hypothetical protein